MAADDFDTVVEQLYAGAPEHFVEQRDAAAKSARAAGEKDRAGRIKQLRRPTAAAAIINRLRRSPDHSGLDTLLDLGERLREAQATLDAPTMKTLSTERNSLIRALLADAAEVSGGPLTGAVREQLSDTFTAAVADAEAGRAVGSGRLVTGLRYSGFGEVDLRDAVAAPLPSPASTPSDPGAGGAGATGTRRAEAAEQSPTEPTGTEPSADAARRAAEHRLDEARSALSAAQEKERAARNSSELAERALDAARRTAKRTRARADAAAAARVTAEEAVRAAEAGTTRR